MRKFSLHTLIALVIAVAFSCSKDDATPVAPSLVGTWKLSSGSNANCTDPADNDTFSCATTDCFNQKYTFTATTLTISMDGFPSITYDYTSSGNNLNITQTTPGLGTSSDSWTYVLTATTLSITNFDDSNGCSLIGNFTRL